MSSAPDLHGVGRGRLEAISDGIIAVAITLLALDIEAPDPEPGQTLFEAFDAQTVGEIALFALSFFLISRFWLVHHRLFSGLDSVVSHRFVGLNFVFLAMICLVPFATTTYANNPDDLTALTIYTAVITGGTMLLSVMFRFTTKIKRNHRRAVAAPLILLSAIPVGAIIGARYAPLVWIALLVLDAWKFERIADSD